MARICRWCRHKELPGEVVLQFDRDSQSDDVDAKYRSPNLLCFHYFHVNTTHSHATLNSHYIFGIHHNTKTPTLSPLCHHESLIMPHAGLVCYFIVTFYLCLVMALALSTYFTLWLEYYYH